MATANVSQSSSNLIFEDVVLNSKDLETPDIEAQSADLYTLNHDGYLQAARNPTTLQLIAGLESFNRSFYEQDDQGDFGNCSGVLSILRFDEAMPSRPVNTGLSTSFLSQAPSRSQSRPHSLHRTTQQTVSPTLDLQKLRNSFDGMCLTAPYAPALRLKKGGPHCQWSNIKCVVSAGLRCLKISYSMRTPDGKALSLSHHFHTILEQGVRNAEIAGQSSPGSKGKEPASLHKSNSSPSSLPTIGHHPPPISRSSGSPKSLNGWTGIAVSESFPQYLSKEMVRGFTIGLNKDQFENILYKAQNLELRSPGPNDELPAVSTYLKPSQHPKAILLGILEDFERRQRDQITRHQSFIQIIEDDVEIQRRPSNKNGNGLARCSIKLSQCNLYLGQMRPKLQYLTSGIEALQSCPGMPQSIEELSFLFPQKAIREKPVPEREKYFGKFWTYQLNEINSRLFHLKSKGEQCKVNVETLQHRVTGNLLMVSNLLQQRENDWIHETEKHRTATSEYQVDMLKKQEVIATRTKRDSTVMKVLAALTALFLPMTFVAVLFTVPFFQWDKPRGQWLLKAPFKLYWEIAMPMTALMMALLSYWFYRLWNEDRNAARDEEEKNRKEDEEAAEEKTKEETAMVEDNEAAEKLKERYLQAMTPVEEDQ